MSKFDPPADPFGNDKQCPICDRALTYNPLIKGYECTHSHDDAPEFGNCEVCNTEQAQYLMHSIPVEKDERILTKPMCNECAWEAFESGGWEADSEVPTDPNLES
jgi:hypothetical protein